MGIKVLGVSLQSLVFSRELHSKSIQGDSIPVFAVKGREMTLNTPRHRVLWQTWKRTLIFSGAHRPTVILFT